MEIHFRYRLLYQRMNDQGILEYRVCSMYYVNSINVLFLGLLGIAHSCWMLAEAIYLIWPIIYHHDAASRSADWRISCWSETLIGGFSGTELLNVWSGERGWVKPDDVSSSSMSVYLFFPERISGQKETHVFVSNSWFDWKQYYWQSLSFGLCRSVSSRISDRT